MKLKNIMGLEYKTREERLTRENRTGRNPIYSALVISTFCLGTQVQTTYANDGASGPGFVPPPKDRQYPPVPPKTVSSSESFNGCCCCPVTPLSRT